MATTSDQTPRNDHEMLEANDLAQLYAWYVIKNKLYNSQEPYDALCVALVMIKDIMTEETSLLMTILCLMAKLHAEVETVNKCLDRIVALLQRILMYEMGVANEPLQEFLEEAKCQAVLRSLNDEASTDEETRALFAHYFGSIKPMNSEFAEELNQLVNGDGEDDETPSLEQLTEKHSLTQFTEELREFLMSIFTRFTTYNIYAHNISRPKEEVVYSEEQVGEGEYEGEEGEEEEEEEEPMEMEDERLSEIEESQEIYDEQQILSAEDDERDSERESLERGVAEETSDAEQYNETDRSKRREITVKEEHNRRDEAQFKEVPLGNSMPVKDEEDEIEEEAVELESEEEPVILEKDSNVKTPDKFITRGSKNTKQREKSKTSGDSSTKKQRQEDEILWESSSDSSIVHTPISNLPNNKQMAQCKKTMYKILYSRRRTGGRGVLWSKEETEELLKGVKEIGVGHWKLIHTKYKFGPSRTPMQLKDKWRNLTGRKAAQ